MEEKKTLEDWKADSDFFRKMGIFFLFVILLLCGGYAYQHDRNLSLEKNIQQVEAENLNLKTQNIYFQNELASCKQKISDCEYYYP